MSLGDFIDYWGPWKKYHLDNEFCTLLGEIMIKEVSTLLHGLSKRNSKRNIIGANFQIFFWKSAVAHYWGNCWSSNFWQDFNWFSIGILKGNLLLLGFRFIAYPPLWQRHATCMWMGPQGKVGQPYCTGCCCCCTGFWLHFWIFWWFISFCNSAYFFGVA